MKCKIRHKDDKQRTNRGSASGKPTRPTMALVKLFKNGITMSYYNDRFNLKKGDIVFVGDEGNFFRGRVEQVTADFNVDKEYFDRVVGRAVTEVRGSFSQAESYLLTFDRDVLPYRQFLTWMKPVDEDMHYIRYDDESFSLKKTEKWGVYDTIFERGVDYHRQNRLLYLSLDGTEGHAVVGGTQPYEVSFRYEDGRISALTCDCPCNYRCKHDVATLLKLKEMRKLLKKEHADEWKQSRYFAIVAKPTFFANAVDGNQDAKVEVHN